MTSVSVRAAAAAAADDDDNDDDDVRNSSSRPRTLTYTHRQTDIGGDSRTAGPARAAPTSTQCKVLPHTWNRIKYRSS